MMSASVIVPARNEELTLPRTLPTILEAASCAAPAVVEVIVVVPDDCVFLIEPPAVHPLLRFIETRIPGKVDAIRTALRELDATSEVLLLVDADIMLEPDAFTELLRSIETEEAAACAGHLVFQPPVGRTRASRLLHRWSQVSEHAWHALRVSHPEHRWALPGALYAVRRASWPDLVEVPLVEDASIGRVVAEHGPIAYAADAVGFVCGPEMWTEWWRQKLRSRRGWLLLRRLHPESVRSFEVAFRRHLQGAKAGQALLAMQVLSVLDAMLRGTARVNNRVQPDPEGWVPTRHRASWETRRPATHVAEKVSIKESR